jgi:hypothetical protein
MTTPESTPIEEKSSKLPYLYFGGLLIAMAAIAYLTRAQYHETRESTLELGLNTSQLYEGETLSVFSLPAEVCIAANPHVVIGDVADACNAMIGAEEACEQSFADLQSYNPFTENQSAGGLQCFKAVDNNGKPEFNFRGSDTDYPVQDLINMVAVLPTETLKTPEEKAEDLRKFGTNAVWTLGILGGTATLLAVGNLLKKKSSLKTDAVNLETPLVSSTSKPAHQSAQELAIDAIERDVLTARKAEAERTANAETEAYRQKVQKYVEEMKEKGNPSDADFNARLSTAQQLTVLCIEYHDYKELIRYLQAEIVMDQPHAKAKDLLSLAKSIKNGMASASDMNGKIDGVFRKR